MQWEHPTLMMAFTNKLNKIFFFFAPTLYLQDSKLVALCPQAIVYCYLEFKLRYLKNLKLFSIKVKEFFEPMVFGKNRSLSNAW